MTIPLLIAAALAEDIRPRHEIARLLGVSAPTLWRWATGRVAPPPSQWRKIAQVLDIPQLAAMADIASPEPITKN